MYLADACNALTQPTPVNAVALQHLCISSLEEPSDFIDCLTLPALTTLEIGIDLEEKPLAPWPGDALERLFKRSSCSVTRLEFVQMSVTEDVFLSFLQQLPQLEELSVKEKLGLTRIIGSDIIRALVITHKRHGALLPNLVTLDVYDTQHFTASELADVVESRGWNHRPLGVVLSGKRLRHIEVELRMAHGAVIDTEGRARLQACQRSGLDITCIWYEIDGQVSVGEVTTL